jgi:16S rRNA (adenine1518-N6/adenine1519-N6)-dimethyltransferase
MIKPKKSLGQNFLRDESVVQKIITSANLTADDFIIEIGPGEGVLTEKLAEQAGKVLAIEIDRNLIPGLENKFKDTPNVEIIHADILNINLSELATNYKLPTTNYRVIANIPYYITSPIIRLFLENTNQPQEMILMVQKEVAERIAAKPGKMSILAVSVQYYADAEILFTVSKNSFFPVPQVDSAVIRITPNVNHETQTTEEVKEFFKIVKAGFSAKRKTLVNNLSNTFHLDKNVVEEKLKTLGFTPNVRAQELSVEDWKELQKLF